MAYLRYSLSCEWYVFGQPDSTLAVWHVNHRAQDGTSFSVSQVQEMLMTNNMGRVPGFESKHAPQLEQAFRSWLQDEAAGEG